VPETACSNADPNHNTNPNLNPNPNPTTDPNNPITLTLTLNLRTLPPPAAILHSSLYFSTTNKNITA